MKFYDLSKEERQKKYAEIQNRLHEAVVKKEDDAFLSFFDDPDTYIRKAAYLGVGKIYIQHPQLLTDILFLLNSLQQNTNERIRQTVAYSCGEIAVYDFDAARPLIDRAVNDSHASVRNAAVGCLKKAGEKNPASILAYCRENILSDNPETRRLMCHGLELRGRTHPQEIIDILKLLQHEQNRRVKAMLVHVLGQISYKKGCLHFVAPQVKEWENKALYPLYQKEVIDVHGRYEKFSEYTQREVIGYFEDSI